MLKLKKENIKRERMIELIFSESASSALRILKQRNDSILKIGDVNILNLHLDIGSLKDVSHDDISSRKEVLEKIYANADKNSLGISGLIYGQCEDTLNMLRNIRGTTSVIRMWASEDSPADMTGVCFICNMFQNTINPLILAKVPKTREIDGSLRLISSTEEAINEDFTMTSADYNLMLYEAKIKKYADIYNNLRTSPHKLRSIINGRLLGVRDDFYDDFILDAFPEYPVPVENLAGMISSYIPSLHREFLLLRISELINKGLIITLSDNEDINEKTVRKA